MFEYFTNIEPKERCILENSTNSIDAAILYLDNDKKLYHYFFKNVENVNEKYVVVSKCVIREDTVSTMGDYIKMEPNYPKVVNKNEWSGLYFTDKYEPPTKITTMFMVQTKYVIQYLNTDVEDKEIILAIQDNKVIFCTQKTRLVNKAIPIGSIWENIENIDTGVMLTVRNITKMYLFSDETYYKIQKPFFGRQTETGYIPLKPINKTTLLNSIIWNYDLGTNCKKIDTIVPIYHPNQKLKIKYYIFQNNSYVRYNIIDHKVDIILSDVTFSTYYLLYSQLLEDLRNTTQELSDDDTIQNIKLIDENIHNLETIINDLCKRKIKLYKKDGNKKHLVIRLNKMIGIKEQLIFQYSNVLQSYNKIDIQQNPDEKCDLKYRNNCINFYNCDSSKCRNINIESTFSYKDSKNIILDISNDFKIERVLYIETYPQLVDDNFKVLWRGLGAEKQSINTILLNAKTGSSNIGIDAVTFVGKDIVFYKSYFNEKNQKLSIEYLKGTIKDSFTTKNNVKNLNNITLLLDGEVPTKENNFGYIHELDSICKIANNVYYIFGKIINSNKTRCIVYDLNKQKAITNIAEDVSIKFKEIGKFNDIISVFNLDPDNKLDNSEPSLCFILNTDINSSKIISNNIFLNKCQLNKTLDCIAKENEDKHIYRVVNLYLNFVSLTKHKNITDVAYHDNKLYVCKKDKIDIYSKLEDNTDEIEKPKTLNAQLITSKFYQIKNNKVCKNDSIIRPNTNVYIPEIDLKMFSKVRKNKKKQQQNSNITYIMYIIIFAIFMVVMYIVNITM